MRAPKGGGRAQRLRADHVHGHHHITLHHQDWACHAGTHVFAPCAQQTLVGPVHHQERGLDLLARVDDGQGHRRGCCASGAVFPDDLGFTNNQSDSPVCQRCLCFVQTFEKEGKASLVGAGVGGNNCVNNEERHIQLVCIMNRDFKCVIKRRTDTPLHPIDHTPRYTAVFCDRSGNICGGRRKRRGGRGRRPRGKGRRGSVAVQSCLTAIQPLQSSVMYTRGQCLRATGDSVGGRSH